MHRFTEGDYLLRTTEDRILLITSKTRCYCWGVGQGTGHTPYLGSLADFRKLKILSKHLLPQFRVREF